MAGLIVLVAVVFVIPATVVGAGTFRLLMANHASGGRWKLVASLAAGVLFIVAGVIPVPHLGVVPRAAIMLIALIAFAMVAAGAPKIDARRRLGIALVVTLAVVGAIELATVDGFEGVACSTILADDTTYAASYSAEGFRRIRAGMNAQEVEDLVGRPLAQWEVPRDRGRSYWRWTGSRTGSHYYRYRLAIFRNGRLEDKNAYFFCAMDW